MNQEEIIKHFSRMSRIAKGATMDDLHEVVSTFSKLIKELMAYYDTNIADKKGKLSKEVTDALQEMMNIEKKIKSMVDTTKASLIFDVKKSISKLSQDIELVKKLIPKMPDMPDMEAHAYKIISKCEESIKSINSRIDIVDTAENFRNRLETLQGNERLDKSAIKGLEDLEKRLSALEKNKSGGGTTYVGGGSSGGGRIVRSYDLSSSLNGSTKTFTLPAFWRIISVQLSSVPNILRPTTDYTVSGTDITFTSEINAGTSLAAGQTCIVIYSEP